MNYRLDKKIKSKKSIKILLGVFLVFLLFLFRASIYRGLSYVSHIIFRPVVILENNLGNKFSNIGVYFYSKKSLLNENQNLKSQLDEMSARVANYNSVVDQNNKIMEMVGRSGEKTNMLLATILSKPNESLYDTLIIDIGTNQGISIGQRVFALGNVPIGSIAEVYPDSSKVILYSNPGEKTEVVISGKDVFMQAVGRGGGNFEIILPRDLVLDVGTEVDLPGINNNILAYVASILSDPRDSFQKALLRSPVNIFELKYVEIER